MKRFLKLAVLAETCLFLWGGYYSSDITISTSGTAVALSTASPTLPTGCIGLTIQAKSTNSGVLWIGGSNVSAANKIGVALTNGMTPPASAYFAPSSTNALYVPSTIFLDTTNSGDKADVTCSR